MRVVFPASLMVVGMGLASCVAPPDEPQTSSEESALTGTNVSVGWDVDKTDFNSIWPTGQGITSTYVLFKKGYAPAGQTATFFAFVIWNTNTVGHIYQVHFGSEGVDFRTKVAGAVATRTASDPDNSGGSTGSGDAGEVIPRPHPSGGDPDQFVFAPAELLNAKTTAGTIDGALQGFFGYGALAAF